MVIIGIIIALSLVIGLRLLLNRPKSSQMESVRLAHARFVMKLEAMNACKELLREATRYHQKR